MLHENELISTADKDRFVIVDGHALIYRAYHGFPGLTDQAGMLVNAVYGFTRILLTAIREFEPEYIAVAFDSKGKTLRAQEYEEYKAHRKPMPDDLRPQIPIIKEIVTALNIPQFEQSGIEADDLIGTIATQLYKKEHHDDLITTIVTGDKDLFQLVNVLVRVWLPPRGKVLAKEYDSQAVEEKMGVTPRQIIDLKALMGDSSDNIPGVKGVGAKTATKLIQAYETLEGVYTELDSVLESGEKHPIIKGALLKRLKQDRENAYLSQKLATIDCCVELDFNLEKCRVSEFDKTKVIEIFDSLGFKSLIPSIPQDSFETSVQEALF